jgi:chaperonin cofactor prefoldin
VGRPEKGAGSKGRRNSENKEEQMSESEKSGQPAPQDAGAEAENLAVQVAADAHRLEELKAQKNTLENEIAALERDTNALTRKNSSLKEALQKDAEAVEQLEQRLGTLSWRIFVTNRAIEQRKAEVASLKTELQYYDELEVRVSNARRERAVLEQNLRDTDQTIQDLNDAINRNAAEATRLGRKLAGEILDQHSGRPLLDRGVRRAEEPAPRESAGAAPRTKYVLVGDITNADGWPAAQDDFKVFSAASGKLLASGKTSGQGHIHIRVPERNVILEVDGQRYPQQAEEEAMPKAASAAVGPAPA